MLNTQKSDENDKILNFFESWFIVIVITTFILLTLLNSLFEYHIAYQNFIKITIGEVLYNLKSSLLSIATIFIGIYVTVFTILGSIRVDSVFAYLNENTFKKLITYIRNAFIASFSYLVLIISLEIVYGNYTDVDLWIIVLNCAIVMYMFLTALRFGIILYISFSKDLDNLQNNIQKHRQEKRKIEELQYKVEVFLDTFEKEQNQKQNEEMSQIIKKDKEDK